MLVLVHQVVVAYRRVLEEVEQGLHGRRRDVVGGQELEPLGAGLLAEPRLEDRQEVRVVLDARSQEPKRGSSATRSRPSAFVSLTQKDWLPTARKNHWPSPAW